MFTEKEKFLTEFGNHLALVRKSCGFTQEDLAYKVDLHRTYIGFIEQGKRNPTVGTMFKIAQALEKELQDFFPPYG
jgi:DNA-binding XRE family transcriptional regulator